MSWHVLVPGTQTVTVVNSPLTYPTGRPLAPRGPASTTTAATFVPFGEAIPPPSVKGSPQPESAATIGTKDSKDLRMRIGYWISSDATFDGSKPET